MNFTDDHQAFRATVRRFVDERINPNVDEWERAGMMPLHEIFKEIQLHRCVAAHETICSAA